jgi:DNA-binding CsgD family transcriptional regulator
VVAKFGLLERDAELTRLGELCSDATAGHGSTVAVQGGAGVGKTTLLRAARVVAEDTDMMVLAASGAELERDLPFGVVRQLFERPLRRLGDSDRAKLLSGAPGLARTVVLDPEFAPPRPETAQAAMYGLYWLAAELAARQPLLLVVDDAHWADRPSLRWVAYLARRLDGVPLLLALACRDAEPGTDTVLLAEVLSEAHAGVLRPRPLTREGVERWLSGRYDEPPADAFVEGCWGATGGNPLLLAELAAELRAEGLAADSEAAARIDGIGPATIARSVLARLARLGPDAVAMAETVAILSADARLDRVAALSGLTPQAAGELSDALAESGILAWGEPVAFAHPVLRNAVYEQIPSARRGLGHSAAARCLLKTEGPERAATHLLFAPAAGDPGAVETLRAAAAAAMGRGAPDAAAVLLRRALAEPPENRSEVLLELAAAEATAQEPTAVEHARAVLVGPSTAAERVQAAVLAVTAQLRVGALQEAREVLTTVERDAELDESARQQLQALALMMSGFSDASALEPQLLALGADDLAGSSAFERLLLSLRSMDLHIRAQSLDQALALARRALAHEDPADPGHDAIVITCARVLATGDRIDEARDAFTALIEGRQARGAVMDVMVPYALRAEAARLAGTLSEAEADARLALDIATMHGPWVLPVALGQLGEILIEREPPAEVLTLIEGLPVDLDELQVRSVNNLIFHARGRARAVAGDLRGAAEDFEACGARQTRWGVINPADIAWRSSLALVLHALGRTADAEQLVAEELEIARDYGVARPLGVALRVRALVGPCDRVVAGLEEAVGTLADSPARLEHARALVDLGAAQRRAGHRTEARETLGVGLDAAHRCGAHQLSERARAELRAAGARPRRERLSGPEALTASERRVAELAADGLTNRQIAQALFVTTKTVEMHLGRAYPKLGIHGRTELASSLGRVHGAESPRASQLQT